MIIGIRKIHGRALKSSSSSTRTFSTRISSSFSNLLKQERFQSQPKSSSIKSSPHCGFHSWCLLGSPASVASDRRCFSLRPPRPRRYLSVLMVQRTTSKPITLRIEAPPRWLHTIRRPNKSTEQVTTHTHGSALNLCQFTFGSPTVYTRVCVFCCSFWALFHRNLVSEIENPPGNRFWL